MQTQNKIKAQSYNFTFIVFFLTYMSAYKFVFQTNLWA